MQMFFHFIHKNKISGFAHRGCNDKHIVQLGNGDQLTHMILQAGKDKSAACIPAKAITDEYCTQSG